MKKLTIRIRREQDAVLRELGERFIKTWKTGKSAGDTLQFESPAALFRVLTPKRWELIEQLQKMGPSSIRGLARALNRDIKRIHDDVRELTNYGLILRTDERKIHIPYGVIHADFDLRAAA